MNSFIIPFIDILDGIAEVDRIGSIGFQGIAEPDGDGVQLAGLTGQYPRQGADDDVLAEICQPAINSSNTG